MLLWIWIAVVVIGLVVLIASAVPLLAGSASSGAPPRSCSAASRTR